MAYEKRLLMRLQTVLPSIIRHNQNAYVKGKAIFDAVRTVDDMLECARKYQINGRPIVIDFQKAFDSVNRNILYKILSAFNFF